MRFVLAALLLALAPSALAQTLTATTADGRTVRLFEDGSWMFASPGEADPTLDLNESGEERTPGIAPGGVLDYALHYDPAAWLSTDVIENPSAEHIFSHASGEAFLMVIPERTYIPVRSLVDVAYQNALETAPDMEIQSRSVVQVDGRDVTRMEMTGTSSGIPVTFLGYYYSSEAFGSIQVAGFTGTSLFAEYEPLFETAMQGLRFSSADDAD